LTARIERETEMPFEKVISIFRNNTSGKFQFFPDQIMFGQVGADEIKSVINPPLGWVDPFKSRVKGRITTSYGRTNIGLNISPSWIVVGFIVVWCILTIIMILKFDFVETYRSLKFIGLTFLWTIIPFGLCKIKVTWDRRRLDKWLCEKIKTVPNII
jgi:hypothetical protein